MIAPKVYYVHHSIWMLLFPLITLFFSITSFVLSFIYFGETIPLAFIVLLDIFLLLCVVEPLNHSFSLFFFLALFYFVSVGIVVLPIWRGIKYWRDKCYVFKNHLFLKSGVVSFTKMNVALKDIAVIQYRTGLYGRLFNYGDLYFYLNNGESYYIRYVQSPADTCEVLMDFVNAAKVTPVVKEGDVHETK